MKNEQIQAIIQAFAKENKVSRAKIKSLANSIIATLPKQGRPVMEKTVTLHNQILDYIKEGKNYTEAIEQVSGIDRVTLHNNIKALENKGAIVRCGRVQTGKRGRQPVLYSLNQQV